jgi:photosystem II stability/assembly factor-like uncharacterized protein
VILALGLVAMPGATMAAPKCRRLCRPAVRLCVETGVPRGRCKRQLRRECRRNGATACDFTTTSTSSTSTSSTSSTTFLPLWKNIGLPPWKNVGPGSLQAFRIFVDPTTPGRVFTDRGVSVNGGATWTPTAPLPVGGVDSFALDPSAAGTIWATSSHRCAGAILKSEDAASSWTIVQSYEFLPCGIETFIPPAYRAVAVDAEGTAYVAGMGRTSDGGASWDPGALTQEPVRLAKAIVVAAGDSPTLYAILGSISPIYRSTDAGDTFSPVGPVDEVFRTLVADATTVFAGTASGHVYRSADGETWLPDAGGLPPLPIAALAVDGGRLGTVYAAVSAEFPSPAMGGLYRSVDGGVSWEARDAGLPQIPSRRLFDVAADPVSPGTVYAAVFELGIFRSDSGGARWAPSLRGNEPIRIDQAAADPFATHTLYAHQVKSTDGGASWRRPPNVPSRSPLGIFPDPLTPGTIYWTGFTDDGSAQALFKTTDGGEGWVESVLSMGFPVRKLAIDPADANTVYACHGTGVEKSIDGGISWDGLVSLPMGGCSGLVIDPTTPSTVYAATPHEVLKSVDGGGSWTTILAADFHLGSALAIDPRNARRLYVRARAIDGLLTTADGGASWTPTAPLPGLALARSIAVNPATSAVYVASSPSEFSVPDRVVAGPAGGTSWTYLSEAHPLGDISRLFVAIDGRTLYAAGGTTSRGYSESGLMSRQVLPCVTDVDCDDENSCTADTCERSTDVCSNTPLDDGSGCDDGDPCTADSCIAGACRSLYVDRDDDGVCDLAGLSQ